MEFEAIGTHWNITVAPPGVENTTLTNEIKRRIEEFEHNYSRFRLDSLVTTMAHSADSYHLPDDARPLLDIYQKLYRLTNGAVTPLIGQVLVDSGYDANYSLEPKSLQQPPHWEDTLDYSWPNLTLKQPALLDFGAAGKGYLVDIIGELLIQHDVTSFCIDAGGDILQHNVQQQTAQIGLEHPDNPLQVIGVATILNQSICGSAGNRRAWKNFTHIINPHTLSSPEQWRAVWVVAEQALIADGLTTALFFTPSTVLATEFDFEYLAIKADYTIEQSAHFPAEVFTANTKLL